MGMSETRVQAATLVCKIFLHYLVLLSEWEGMLDLWLKILDILDRMMNSGQGDSLVSLSLCFSFFPFFSFSYSDFFSAAAPPITLFFSGNHPGAKRTT